MVSQLNSHLSEMRISPYPCPFKLCSNFLAVCNALPGYLAVVSPWVYSETNPIKIRLLFAASDLGGTSFFITKPTDLPTDLPSQANRLTNKPLKLSCSRGPMLGSTLRPASLMSMSDSWPWTAVRGPAASDQRVSQAMTGTPEVIAISMLQKGW